MKNYQLRKEDFIPLIGFCSYIKRNSQCDLEDDQVDLRGNVLFFYNSVLFLSGLITYTSGLEKLLQ